MFWGENQQKQNRIYLFQAQWLIHSGSPLISFKTDTQSNLGHYYSGSFEMTS